MPKISFIRLAILFALPFYSFNGISQTLPDNIDISTSPNGIVTLPSTVPSVYATNNFVKYTKIQCPNGEAIHFIAQNLISDAQILYSKAILEFYLSNFTGSQFGSDKTAVINSMGTNNATLMIVNGTHVEGQEPNINAQGLYQNEVSVPGHTWYQNNNYDHRDAAFEEILHLMHDKGIGVDGPNSTPGALPAYQTEIRAAQNNAILNNYAIWPKGAANDPSWFNDLNAENSLSQEYLASLIDSYYGLWGAWTGSPSLGMWGEYISKTRSEIQTEDPMGWALVPKFFSPFVNVDMVIDPTFNGVFSLTFNSTDQYTHKSQYLQHCYLTGTNDSGLKGNDEYNRLKGNTGDNTFEGMKGNDNLDGQGGSNTAIFSGNSSDYTVDNFTTYAIITDNVANRDGIDTLWNMHFLKYTDQTTPISIQSTLAVDDIEHGLTNVTLFPNPTNETLKIHVNSNSKHLDIEILNIAGQIVYSNINIDSKNLTIDVSHLLKGVYMISVKTDNETSTQKFVKN
ncbi:MAG: T9SS type A sorting domain-containing protein [Flavobacteriales bacterium]